MEIEAYVFRGRRRGDAVYRCEPGLGMGGCRGGEDGIGRAGQADVMAGTGKGWGVQ